MPMKPHGRRGLGQPAKDALTRALLSPAVWRPASAVLRHVPVPKIGKKAIVARAADVREVLERNDDFFLAPAFVERLERVNGLFFMGMERSEERSRELRVLSEAIRREGSENDLGRIRNETRRLVADVLAEADPHGRIEVVDGLARAVTVRLLGSYLGITAPDEAAMRRWTRDLFEYLFFSRGLAAAYRSGTEMRRRIRQLIDERRAAFEAGGWPVEPPGDADVLTRLLVAARGADPRFDDDAIARNLVGIAIPVVEEITRAVVYALDELLRRPEPLRRARCAALVGDIDTVRQYVFEAMRFKPNGPMTLPRRCEATRARIAAGSRWQRWLHSGTSVAVCTLSAMFDRREFDRPRRFLADRPLDSYLHFGDGLHGCFGKRIAAVVVPELVAAVLCLSGLRRAPGPAGRLRYRSLLPDRMTLVFSPAGSVTAAAGPDSEPVEQSVVTIVTPVQPDRVDQLDGLLDDIAADLDSALPLCELPTVHFASLVVAREGDGGPSLIFESNVDGPLDAYLDALFDNPHLAKGLSDVYQHCAGFPRHAAAGPARVKAYLRSHAVRVRSYRVGNPGRSVVRIRAEQQLRAAIGELLDKELDQGRLPSEPLAIRQRILQFVEGDRRLRWAAAAPPPARLTPAVLGHRARLVVGGVGVLAAYVATLPALLVKELFQDRPSTAKAADQHVERLERREDLGPHSHLAAISTVKPGRLRRFTLKTVLWAFDAAGRAAIGKGVVSGFERIHFAHFCLIDGDRRLLFFSNYNGTWGGYLDDFIVHASKVLTAVWTNTDGFPETRFLLWRGARDGAAFKKWERTQQVPTAVWYRAYQDLTVAAIDRNSEIRARLSSAMDAEAARGWLKLL